MLGVQTLQRVGVVVGDSRADGPDAVAALVDFAAEHGRVVEVSAVPVLVVVRSVGRK